MHYEQLAINCTGLRFASQGRTPLKTASPSKTFSTWRCLIRDKWPFPQVDNKDETPLQTLQCRMERWLQKEIHYAFLVFMQGCDRDLDNIKNVVGQDERIECDLIRQPRHVEGGSP